MLRVDNFCKDLICFVVTSIAVSILMPYIHIIIDLMKECIRWWFVAGSGCPESEKMFWVKYKQEGEEPPAPRRPCSGWTRLSDVCCQLWEGNCVLLSIIIFITCLSSCCGKSLFSFKPFILWHKQPPVTDIVTFSSPGNWCQSEN